VLVNFWKLACHWNNEQSRLALPWTTAHDRLFGPSWPSLRVHTPLNTPRELPKVTYRTIHSPNTDVIAICEMIGVADHTSPFVLLDSAAEPSRFTIIGSLHASSTRFTHHIGDDFVTIVADGVTTREKLNHHDVWSWAAAFMHSRRFTGGDLAIPFWGGLVGVLSYELGVHGLQVNIPAQSTSRAKHPDVNLVFVERSLVYDHVTENLCVQSLWPEDPWIEETISSVEKRICFSSKVPATQKCKPILPRALTPDKDQYISRVRECQDHLAVGESYELCLTARTQVVLPPGSSIKTSWDLYKSARKRNPAPHSAYIRLHPTTLVSTSPERFLSFSRPPNTICQLRPMKGTVRKSADVDRATAERLLVGSTKEVAENLMIVDLIRHDLHGVVGPDVRVLQFCGVEEYKTVWTMVSVIEGRISNDVQGSELEAEGELGWEVLRRSLPPGSMTGAPKKRSVEILQTLEDDERAIYSGVFGYWDVGGSGDWAVTIRSCFKHDEESLHPDLSSEQGDTWVIGAGGAITALSDPEAEWEEMMLKLQGVLRAFHDGDD
jgi:para-aminobenzoate synthetase